MWVVCDQAALSHQQTLPSGRLHTAQWANRRPGSTARLSPRLSGSSGPSHTSQISQIAASCGDCSAPLPLPLVLGCACSADLPLAAS